jgi:replicative DNA helicase
MKRTVPLAQLNANGMVQAEATGVRSGFHELDRLTSGFQPGELIFVASRYSVGKTALALNIAEYLAISEHLPVLVFCLASCASELKMRLAGSISGVCLRNIQSNFLSGEDWDNLNAANTLLQGSKLHIEGSTHFSVKQLFDHAKLLADQHGKLGLIVVDDLQCTHFVAKRGRAVGSELGALSQGLKSLAQEHRCPVIVPTQLGAAIDSRRDKRPRLGDLRTGGKQEQEADTIITVYRDDYYNGDASPSPGVAEIGVVKHASGNTGCAMLAFNKSLAKFENLTTNH